MRAIASAFGYDVSIDLHHGLNWESMIGNSLWELNHAAYDCRYAHRTDIDFGYHERYEYKRTNLKLLPLFEPQARADAYQFLATLDCFIYQCHEGDIANHDALKILKQIRDNIANFLIVESSEYKSANWG